MATPRTSAPRPRPARPRAPARARTTARAHAAPGTLSAPVIRAAALRVIDAEGLAAFSTRKLGRELGCEAMAIYWYYDSKDALLDGVVDELMAEVSAVVVDRDPHDWVSALREVAHAYRNVARTHPRAFPLLATRRFASEATYAFLERLFELGRQRGIDDRTVAQFYRVVSSYCNGFGLNELAAPRGPQDPRTAALRRSFPRVEAVSTWLEPRHQDEIFRFGLELQLDALTRASAEVAA